MKASRDSRTLIIIVLIFVVAFYLLSRQTMNRTDSYSSYSSGKHGTKALYTLLEEMHYKVGRYTGSVNAIPKNAKVVFIVEPVLDDEDGKALAEWVKQGNTLVLAASMPWSLSQDFDISASSNPFVTGDEPVTPLNSRYSDGVKKVYVDARLDIKPDSKTESIVMTEDGLAVAEQPLGKGRLILIGDPMLLSNSEIREQDNVVLVTNMVDTNAAPGDKVLFIEYGEIIASRGISAMGVIGRGGRLAVFEILLVVLLVVISASRRFGAIHPLAEKEERPRGWEFVRAMAGLYRRAEAREVAVGSVYKSFRRDLSAVFGVSPDASPEDASETVLRTRQMDRARLTSLLHKCNELSKQKLTDHEAIGLLKTIEECRRELGIARTNRD